ncbi:MAG TPA: murein transglycosylase A, partial [Stellaceae bacterium]|nr:murein transglycosylase A [Stellaceae bacterium]
MIRGWPAVVFLALLAACTPRPPPPDKLTLAPASFADLAGWQQEDFAGALGAFGRSCARLLKRPETTALGIAGTVADWRAPCAALAALEGNDAAAARRFFETWFTPWKAGNNGKAEGLFTGYYEPELSGARAPGGRFQTPLLRRPPDLVMVELGLFRPAWRGERIAGRVVEGRLKPYESRAEIERGALDRYHLGWLWVDDPIDAFFLQIQGSGRVRLADGSEVRVGYDGQNGHPYVAIGKLLADRGVLERDAVSMQAIRAWIKANPEPGKALMAENPSYVFFRELDGDGPIGSEGAVLTAGRSLAVDRDFVPLGVPLWLDAGAGAERLQRLVVAQDTGGAIRGPVRGDVFWGFG